MTKVVFSLFSIVINCYRCVTMSFLVIALHRTIEIELSMCKLQCVLLHIVCLLHTQHQSK